MHTPLYIISNNNPPYLTVVVFHTLLTGLLDKLGLNLNLASWYEI